MIKKFIVKNPVYPFCLNKEGMMDEITVEYNRNKMIFNTVFFFVFSISVFSAFLGVLFLLLVFFRLLTLFSGI